VPGLEIIALIVLVPVACAFSIPLIALFQHHRRKMEELRQKEQRLIAADIQAEFEKLRAEIRDLRDVTMQYDLSFDTALQQMEHRVAHLERPQYGQQHAVTPTESILRAGQK
jgi:hypothetical protein